MLFFDLQRNLLDALRARIRNGELTERGLARLTGVSQPHVHNVLKGTRILSLDLADRILVHLHLSVTDLIQRPAFNQVGSGMEDQTEYAHLQVLQGKIGPRHLWPTITEAYERFPVCKQALAQMTAPIAARFGPDPEMANLFSEGDFGILDQGYASRTLAEPSAYYAVRKGQHGCVRKIRIANGQLLLVAEGQLEAPDSWESIDLSGQHIQHFVRARVTFVTPEIEWKTRAD
ncbi:MAG: helix-turn-helix transcriptional regulator [Bryobacteraceae bacterium]